MKKQKKQNLLSAIIIILVIALAMLVGSIVYEEMINISKQQDTQNVSKTENKNDITSGTKEEEQEGNVDVEDDEPSEQPTEKEEFVGEEEKEDTETTTENKDEKAIKLVKQKWGDDDSVTFSIENKNGNKYYVAVKSDNKSTVWYEVDTETWQISEF